MRAGHSSQEPRFTPSQPAWQAHERAARQPGETLDAATAAQANALFGFDFSGVRIHRDEAAAQAAAAMSAQAYTYGADIFFQPGGYEPRGSLLLHELGHVVEQAHAAPAVMRAPAQTTPSTYIIIYGTGRVNPETPVDHNVGQLFKMAAAAKRREIVARLGKAAPQHNIVFEYCPTEKELQAVLNRKYALPVQEVHIFSHGWKQGINLGGPDPGLGKKAPDDKPQERRVVPSELGDYDVNWASQPNVVLYGCNTGNPDGSPAFAQSVSDAFGVPVKGPTTSSHFEFGGPWGTQQVPDKPGKMVEYTPTPAAIQRHLTVAEAIVAQIAVKMKSKGGLLQIMKSTQDAYALRARLTREARWLNRVLGDTRLTIADRPALRAKLAALIKRADALLAN